MKIISFFIVRVTENQGKPQKEFQQQATIQNELPDDNKILKLLSLLQTNQNNTTKGEREFSTEYLPCKTIFFLTKIPKKLSRSMVRDLTKESNQMTGNRGMACTYGLT